MSENLLYTYLEKSRSSLAYSANKILTPSVLTKVINSDIRLLYRTGTNNLGTFTMPRNLSATNKASSDYSTPSNFSATNYTNNSVKVTLLQPKSSTSYKTSFQSNNVETISNVTLTNTTIKLIEEFNAKNITQLTINFSGTPTDNFSKKVIETTSISNGSTVYINPYDKNSYNTTSDLWKNGQIITNAGIKNLADRFETLHFHVREAKIAYNNMQAKTHESIIGGTYSVGTPAHKSRLYGQTERTANNNFTFETKMLDLSSHTEKYGFTHTDTGLSHVNSSTSRLLKTASGSFATNTSSDNKDLVVYFDRNQMTAEGVLGLIPAGSNITFEESGTAGKTITIKVKNEYILVGRITQEYYTANSSHLYLKVGNTYNHSVFDSTEDKWYSLEQVFTITAPAFKESD
jgi:hypothetical protein